MNPGFVRKTFVNEAHFLDFHTKFLKDLLQLLGAEVYQESDF